MSALPALAQEAPASRSGSVLNVILLAGIAYFLVRSFRRRSGNGQSRPGRSSRSDTGADQAAEDDAESGQGDAGRPGPRGMDRHEAARQTWDWLSSEDAGDTAPTTPTGPVGAFNEAEFLEGAKMFFSRFQQAAGEQDFESIRDFMSDEVYAQALAEASRERTEIMLLSAKLMEMKPESTRTMASVFFDAQLRVGEDGRPVHLRTVWEFSRDDKVPNALWILDKINSIDQ